MLLGACRTRRQGATRYPSQRVPSGMNLVERCGTLGVTNVARFFVRHVPARRQTETPCLSFIESVVHVGPRAGNLHAHGLKVRFGRHCHLAASLPSTRVGSTLKRSLPASPPERAD